MKTMILTAAALAMLSTAASAQTTVRIGTEGAYPPWNFVNEAGELAGYEIDLANAICETADIQCEIVQNDWDSIIPNLLAGNYDVIMAGMSVTEERLQTIDFTEEYFPPEPSLFAALPGSNFDFGNLTGLRIGVQSNTIQAAYAEENLSDGNTIISFATPDQSIADLAAGNIDLLLADNNFLGSVVGNSSGTIEFVGPEIRVGGGIAGGIRKDDAELKATLDAAILALREDGTVNALITQWFGDKGSLY